MIQRDAGDGSYYLSYNEPEPPPLPQSHRAKVSHARNRERSEYIMTENKNENVFPVRVHDHGPAYKPGKVSNCPACIEIRAHRPPPDAIHTDPLVQHIDIRIYFDRDVNRKDMLDNLSDALQDSPDLYEMISAYELVNDGFAHMVPAGKPLA